MISKLEKLKMLDSKEITDDERVQSKSTYGVLRNRKTDESTNSQSKQSRRRSTIKNIEVNK